MELMIKLVCVWCEVALRNIKMVKMTFYNLC